MRILQSDELIDDYKLDAVKNNAAEFVLNPVNGNTTIVWKETGEPAFVYKKVNEK